MVRQQNAVEEAFPPSPVGLDELLTGIAAGLAAAQGALDRSARGEVDDRAMRPLWFVFERTSVELELSTFVTRGARLQCRTLDPLAVALRGHAQASSTRVRVEIAPLGANILRQG